VVDRAAAPKSRVRSIVSIAARLPARGVWGAGPRGAPPRKRDEDVLEVRLARVRDRRGKPGESLRGRGAGGRRGEPLGEDAHAGALRVGLREAGAEPRDRLLPLRRLDHDEAARPLRADPPVARRDLAPS
jgi:hypothetical protein